MKKTSQLSRVGKLAGLRLEKAEKAVSEARMERKWHKTSEKDFLVAESRQVSGFAA
ncbi:hypothetical protein QFZ77_002023 [Paenibacillus sp. V4I3]|uniref:hypothetical protein n=1 Tax=unclassified Paenibacillus TaxID=185978 RepID=UPI00278B0DC5|nr:MULTISPECIES: hypothetical protein [unclassified Paenibacillus]MDQ0873364.1 hypothetical protein [Paenibacillus sp. V4I3]MDQ0890718.1 hypothetical protein [Paenibacillus sp. V4I9]